MFLFALTAYIGTAQDFDVYSRDNNDHFRFPVPPNEMFYDEFQILSRDIRMMDMAYGFIVPGYVHFKAKENRTGYWLLALRLTGYGCVAYAFTNLPGSEQTLKNLWNYPGNYKPDNYIFIAGVSLIATTYIYDWIHGKAALEQKQEKIRYKYSMKIKFEQKPDISQEVAKPIPVLSLKYHF